MYENQLDKEWKYILNDCGAKFVFAGTAATEKRVREVVKEVPVVEHVIGFEASDDKSYKKLLEIGAKTPAPPVTPGIVPAPPLSGPQILPGSTQGTGVLGNTQQTPLSIAPVAAVAVPIGLVLLALSWMLAGATGLDRMATAATSSVAAEECPLEKP